MFTSTYKTSWKEPKKRINKHKEYYNTSRYINVVKVTDECLTFRNIAAYLKVKFNRLIWNGISNGCTWNENCNNKLKFIVRMNT